jgi:hypothetical protein
MTVRRASNVWQILTCEGNCLFGGVFLGGIENDDVATPNLWRQTVGNHA